jgi:Uma2 family endonuclease
MKRDAAPDTSSTRLVSWEDFVRLHEDDPRELIDGVLVETEVPTELHEWVVARLITALGNWAEAHGGVVLGSGYKVRITTRRAVMPDVQLYRKDNPSRRGRLGLEAGHPDLAIEVVSSSSAGYDRVRKLSWYASLGVPEYWLVDPEERTLQRMLLTDGRYLIVDNLDGDVTFAPQTFPGLAIPLADLWVVGGSGPAAR